MSQLIFEGIDNVTLSGFLSVHTLSRFGADNQDLTTGVYAIIEPDQSLSGYLLLIDTLEYSHDFGLLAMLDYPPIQVDMGSSVQTFPSIQIKSGETKAFRFSLPPLPEGLHTVILSLIVEPDIDFSSATSSDLDPVKNEARSFRGSPLEFGLLIWVTCKKPVAVADWPEQARCIPPEKTTLVNECKNPVKYWIFETVW